MLTFDERKHLAQAVRMGRRPNTYGWTQGIGLLAKERLDRDDAERAADDPVGALRAMSPALHVGPFYLGGSLLLFGIDPRDRPSEVAPLPGMSHDATVALVRRLNAAWHEKAPEPEPEAPTVTGYEMSTPAPLGPLFKLNTSYAHGPALECQGRRHVLPGTMKGDNVARLLLWLNAAAASFVGDADELGMEPRIGNMGGPNAA